MKMLLTLRKGPKNDNLTYFTKTLFKSLTLYFRNAGAHIICFFASSVKIVQIVLLEKSAKKKKKKLKSKETKKNGC
jgi:hypothetical protein